MKELYIETLAALFPTREALESAGSKSLLNFLQKIFRFKEIEHQDCLEAAKKQKVTSANKNNYVQHFLIFQIILK